MYRVVFPFELKLPNTTDDAAGRDALYSLFAVVVHVGSGPHHGETAGGGFMLGARAAVLGPAPTDAVLASQRAGCQPSCCSQVHRRLPVTRNAVVYRESSSRQCIQHPRCSGGLSCSIVHFSCSPHYTAAASRLRAVPYLLLAALTPAGHYVSLIKSKNTWLYFDDDTVDIIPESTVAATFGNTQVRGGYTSGMMTSCSRPCRCKMQITCSASSRIRTLTACCCCMRRYSTQVPWLMSQSKGCTGVLLLLIFTLMTCCVLACCWLCRSSASTWTMATSYSMSECHEGVSYKSVMRGNHRGC